MPFNTNIRQSNKKIYINPNFRGSIPALNTSATTQSKAIIPANAHINPLFLEAQRYGNTIHMNPAFLEKFQQRKSASHKILLNNSEKFEHQHSDYETNELVKKCETIENGKIICKSKNRLIRKPLKEKDDHILKIAEPLFSKQPLLVLNKRKLVRKIPITPGETKSKKINLSCSNTTITKYKLDNRAIRKKTVLPPIPKVRRTSYVGRYALKRTSVDESSNTIRSTSINNKSKNKKLQVLNINGLLYKSTRNSLKLKSITPAGMLEASKQNASKEKPVLNANQGLTIFVRGEKYVMDANKFKLTRVSNSDHDSCNHIKTINSYNTAKCQRIDIGGYTYVSINSTKNVLIRTTNHLSRAYVHNAKQKSLNMLTKCLIKTNVPCAIFQRIGKCAAFDRGKCSKVHNRLQVDICSKFLRGECTNSACLLSHNISLSKMPVCKFFLQGVCVRNDCQYLHKKLSNCAKICTDFLRGFCQMAEKCNKRHEFVCPEIERNNICNSKNCVHCKAKKRKERQLAMKPEKVKNRNSTSMTTIKSLEVAENQSCKRYFRESCESTMLNTNENKGQLIIEDTNTSVDTEYFEEYVENSCKTRPKLGSLPSYIPL